MMPGDLQYCAFAQSVGHNRCGMQGSHHQPVLQQFGAPNYEALRLLLRAHNDAHKHRVRLATLFVGKMAELFGDAVQIMAPKKDAVSASLTAVLEANGEPVQQISVDIVQSLLQLQQDSASKEFNKAFKMLELAFQLHSDIKSCRDWAEQAACDTYNASYEAICETWPTVLKLKHSLVVIQARFQAIKGGESLEVRNGMLARAKEIQDKDAQ